MRMPRAKNQPGRAARPPQRGPRDASGKARPGLPAPSSIVSVKTFTSPKGRRYRIIETDEADGYDPPVRRRRGTDR
jgi:hypothetical protein